MQWLNHFFVTQVDPSHLAMGHYNILLVALSVSLAVAASFFALHFASIAQHIVIEKYKNIALVSGSFIMAGGIWSMHFVGMLAFNMGHAISYDPLLTALSLLPSIVASYITLKRLIKPNLTLWELLVGGVLVGSGIGAMHYIGMAAMQMSVDLRYDPVWFVLSLVIAVVLASIALSTHYYVKRLSLGLSQIWINSISALIMGMAISGMHYAGMAGARFISDGHTHMADLGDRSNGYFSFVVATITLLLSILAANIASQLRYRQLLQEKTASEIRLKTTLDTAIDAIISIDSNGMIKAFNKAAETLFGWSEKDIIGRSFHLLFPTHHAEAFNTALTHFRNTNEVTFSGAEYEIEAVNKNGKVFPIRLGVGLVDIPGSETLFVGFISDISARKTMEKAIKASEKQLSSLIKNIPGASFRCLMDDEWTTLFVSDAIYDVAGWTTEDFYNNRISFGKMIHPEDKDKAAHTVKEATKEHNTYKIEYRLTHKNGHSVWVLENGSVIYNEQGEPEWIDGVILDISQRVKIEDELRLAKAKAEASAESKASFLANMSHEIRTPMNAIIGFSDILLESDTTDENKKHLATISKSARSLLHLLNDILDSAKLEKNKLELDIQPFMLSNMVDTVISTLWLQARNKGLALHFHIAQNVATSYWGAEDRIRQVLMNILGNAIKFTEQGSVTLTITKQDNEHLRFAVKDTGIGIAEERLTHIFDPFTQADASMSRRFGGTGLGTSISKQLVTLMGGDIQVSSELGIGSDFYFDLPLIESDLPVDTATPQLTIIKPKKILIADDIEQNLTLLTLLLKRHGHAIFVAKDGLEAVEQFKSIQPDLILMDIQMPKMDGLMATQIIRQYEKEKQLSHTPIIALTANVLIEDKRDAQQAGMDGFANKPIDLHNLTAEMARVLTETSNNVAQNHLTQDHLTHDETPDLHSLPPSHLKQSRLKSPQSRQKHTQIHLEKGLLLWRDLAVYLSEMAKFLTTNVNLVDVLTKHVLTHEYQQIGLLAHAIKGTSGNLALLSISNTMAAIEMAASAEDAEQCQANIQALRPLLDCFSEELATLMQTHATDAETAEAPSTPLNKVELPPLIDALITSASLGEINDETIQQLIRHVPSEMKKQAIDIGEAIADFNFNLAIEQLNDLTHQLKTNNSKQTTQQEISE
ncbi:PAS domain S-box protein [Marinomonas sp. M1K-6]|uniref:histidine kinase n=1 Tax=Marinomonas profundi TaxID=2726122 RepID=A0A847RA87_9GAMM|nr:MHYT domain-containing protein [Marinomonas profundi]NLQ18956.1 PAS domain S-box protein [Marinomonas profundi]UDV02305.1 PAS domain S-box protein [Marinomonas profundi]